MSLFELTDKEEALLRAILDAKKFETGHTIQEWSLELTTSLAKQGFIIVSIAEQNQKMRDSYEAGYKNGERSVL